MMDERRLQTLRMPFDGYERSFRAYVPESCERGKAAPLLITLHGGDYARAHERTNWHALAEEKRFLVLYPEALRPGVMWNAWSNFSSEHGRADDVRFLDGLLDHVLSDFPIDASRVYLHGQSMGDMMGTHYAFTHPERIAAALLCSGPTKTKWWMTPPGEPRFRPAGSCPVMRLHGENDCFQASGLSPTEAMLYKQQCHVEPNARCWIEANRCASDVQIETSEEYNLLRYGGADGADFWALSIKNGEHRPPAFVERFAWERFFSGYRLEAGAYVRVAAEREFEVDCGGAAVAAGTANVYVDNQPLRVEAEPAISRDGVIWVDTRALCAIAEHIAPGSLDSVNRVAGGAHWVPFCHAMRDAFGYCAQEAFDAAYAAPHAMRLTFDLAYTLRVLLGAQRPLTSPEAYLLEDRIYRVQCADAGFAPPQSREQEVWQWGHTV